MKLAPVFVVLLVSSAVPQCRAAGSPESLWMRASRLQDSLARGSVRPQMPSEDLVRIAQWNMGRLARLEYEFAALETAVSNAEDRIRGFDGDPESLADIEVRLHFLRNAAATESGRCRNLAEGMEFLLAKVKPPVEPGLAETLRRQDAALRKFDSTVAAFQKKASSLRLLADQNGAALGPRALGFASAFDQAAGGLAGHMDRAKTASDRLLEHLDR
jgi:hypothetical protein